MDAINGSERYVRTLELPHFAPLDWGKYAVRLLVAGEKLFDMMAVVAAIYISNSLHCALRPRQAVMRNPSATLLCALVVGSLFVFLLERNGGYRPCVSLLGIRETERILRVTLETLFLSLGTAYFLAASFSRVTIALAGALTPLLLILEKWKIRSLLRALRSTEQATRKAVILGTGAAARRIYTSLVHSPKFGIEPVAFIDPDEKSLVTEIYECSYRREHSAQVLRGPLHPSLLRRLNASVLIVAQPDMDRQAMLLAMSEAAESGVATYSLPEEAADAACQLDYTDVDGIVLAYASQEQPRPLFELGKRIIDVVLSAIVLLLFAVFAPLVALLVKRSSPGPVFFRQERVGKDGRLFTMYKFRTMYADAPKYGYSPGVDDDPRVTSLGRFLRRSCIDEIPQLINVLLGQMSLVGPRPEMPFIVAQYTPAQRRRLSLKPGLTGLWQLSADRAFPIHHNLEYDTYYLANNPRFLWLTALQLAGIRKFCM